MKIKTNSKENIFNINIETQSNNTTVTYGVVREKYYLSNCKSRKAYGIIGFSNAEINGTATIVLAVNDITSDRKAISKLAQILNIRRVAPDAVSDIVEEFIS